MLPLPCARRCSLVSGRAVMHSAGMRRLPFLICLLLCPGLALAEPVFYPAVSGNAHAPVLVVYSSLDEPLAQPMIRGFQEANPDVSVTYEDMLTGEIYDRIVRETDAGQRTADFAFSSAMDLQVKLSNDGYAQPSNLAMSGAGRNGRTGATPPMR
jgi:iron(III) transport system substrate-binding protein